MMAHALLGPSGAKRWMACTPSARFEEEFTEQESIFAAEGTEAHALAEAYQTDNDYEVLRIKAEGTYYNGEMEEAVGLYLDIVDERYVEILKRDPSTLMMAEQRLDFSEWVPEGFGTGDTIVIGGGIIEVIDLKYGKGVPVDATNNPQLKLYGLGAWNTYKILYDIHTVRVTIVQPRLGSVTTWDISVDDLVRWADEEVAPRARMAWDGTGPHVPGDHCKFCKAKPRCKAIADYYNELARHDFAMPHKLTDQDIADILGKMGGLMDWAKAVKEYALAQAENNGAKWPGWKLVEGRSNRMIKEIDLALKILVDGGFKEPMLYKPREVLGITALESLVGKKKLNTMLDNLIIKPVGKPTLVVEGDKRPELNTNAAAAADFTPKDMRPKEVTYGIDWEN